MVSRLLVPVAVCRRSRRVTFVFIAGMVSRGISMKYHRRVSVEYRRRVPVQYNRRVSVQYSWLVRLCRHSAMLACPPPQVGVSLRHLVGSSLVSRRLVQVVVRWYPRHVTFVLVAGMVSPVAPFAHARALALWRF